VCENLDVYLLVIRHLVRRFFSCGVFSLVFTELGKRIAWILTRPSLRTGLITSMRKNGEAINEGMLCEWEASEEKVSEFKFKHHSQ